MSSPSRWRRSSSARGSACSTGSTGARSHRRSLKLFTRRSSRTCGTSSRYIDDRTHPGQRGWHHRGTASWRVGLPQGAPTRRVAKALMIGIPNGIVEERIVRIDPPRSFEPLGNEMIAGVYVDLPQPLGAGVNELVRHAGRHHKDLLVGVPVQPRAASRRGVYDDDQDAGAEKATLELAGLFPARRVGYVQDACHAPPPAEGSASGMGASRNGGTIASSHSARSITPLPGGMK